MSLSDSLLDLKVQVGGGGFSPGKLRSVLLGVEKKRKENEDTESAESSQISYFLFNFPQFSRETNRK